MVIRTDKLYRTANQNEERTVQVRVKRKRIVDGYASGATFFTTPARARVLMDNDAVDIVGGDVQGSSEADAGKSLAVLNNGPTTASASSGQSGTAEQSSASAAAPASAQGTSSESGGQGQQTASASSPSTAPTNAAQVPTSSTSQMRGSGKSTVKPKASKATKGKK